MKKSILGLLVLVFAAQAQASRQAVTCQEVSKSKSKIKVYLDYDPALVLDDNWQKDAKGNTIIVPYTLGAADIGTETTVRVGIEIPNSQFRKPYSGRFLLTGLYDANSIEEAGSGYSYKFGGQAYRSFHGSDENGRWDAMVYIPDSVTGQTEKSFPGLLTIQMDLMDQGYYHIDLTCSSVVK